MSPKPSTPAGQQTVVSANSALQGDLRVRGSLRVDGAVYGNVTTDSDMSVGPHGRILGEVRAAQLALAGRIDGIVRVRQHLHVLASGVLRGHARYSTLQIDRGGVMDGSTSSGSDLPESSDEDDDAYAAAQ